MRADQQAKEANEARVRAEENGWKAEAALHSIKTTAALQAWERHDLHAAEEILDQLAAGGLTWECRHLRGLCRRKAMTLRGHGAGLLAVSYSPDGARIASGGADGTLRVWDVRTGLALVSVKEES